MVAIAPAVYDGADLISYPLAVATVPVAITSAGLVIAKIYSAKLGAAVELAAWQLRRIYELVSRREDLGVNLDSGTRLEMELRLSEAAFLLTSLEPFERPEKFRPFQRMSRNSPFREITPDEDSPTSPSATNVIREPESNPATQPDFSSSAS